VTFRLTKASDFDEFHLADRLRMNGWIVPAYTLPPNAEDVNVLRVVVRNDMSRDKVDVLMRHIEDACDYLDGKGMPSTELGAKTHEKQRRRC
jgi:glutamate decarboxylase